SGERMRRRGIAGRRDAPEHGFDVRHGLAVDLLERLRAAADPDRRVRPLHGPRIDREVPDAVVSALVAHMVAGPERLEELDRLVHPRAALPVGPPHERALPPLPTDAAPNDPPPP